MRASLRARSGPTWRWVPPAVLKRTCVLFGWGQPAPRLTYSSHPPGAPRPLKVRAGAGPSSQLRAPRRGGAGRAAAPLSQRPGPGSTPPSCGRLRSRLPRQRADALRGPPAAAAALGRPRRVASARARCGGG